MRLVAIFNAVFKFLRFCTITFYTLTVALTSGQEFKNHKEHLSLVQITQFFFLSD